jgi:ER membrane protein complex subunit 4
MGYRHELASASKAKKHHWHSRSSRLLLRIQDKGTPPIQRPLQSPSDLYPSIKPLHLLSDLYISYQTSSHSISSLLPEHTSPPPPHSSHPALSPPVLTPSLLQKLGPSKESTRIPPTPHDTALLKLKKAWEVAFAPAKSIPMNAIMMYMSGNSLQIFSIMMVMMLFKNPIMGLMATNSAFSRFESEGTRGKILGCKVVYVGLQLCLLGLGVWKVDQMGLLP